MYEAFADNVREIDYANELARLKLEKKRKLDAIERRTIKQVRKKIKREKEEKTQGFLSIFFKKKKKRQTIISDYLSERFDSAAQLYTENIGSQMVFRGLNCDGGEENLSNEENEKKEQQVAAQKAEEGERTKTKNAEVQGEQKRTEAIKKLLHKIKSWSIGAALGTFGLSLIVPVLVWIGQFAGKYIFKIKALPGFDAKDGLMMICFAFIFAIVVMPIIAFVGMLDTLGLL